MEEARDQALPVAEEVCCSSGTTPYQKSLNLQAAAPPGPGACLWHISMVHGTFANLEAFSTFAKLAPASRGCSVGCMDDACTHLLLSRDAGQPPLTSPFTEGDPCTAGTQHLCSWF